MKNSVIKKIIGIILTVVQVLILIPPIALQYLSDKKMGVKRYLIFKESIFSKDIFTVNVIFMLKIMFSFGILICIVLITYYSLRKTNEILVKSLIKLSIINILADFCVFSKQFGELITYHFFLIAAIVIVVLQYIKIPLAYKKSNRY